ncbi:unnamed protein product [Merluccius merluccius]
MATKDEFVITTLRDAQRPPLSTNYSDSAVIAVRFCGVQQYACLSRRGSAPSRYGVAVAVAVAAVARSSLARPGAQHRYLSGRIRVKRRRAYDVAGDREESPGAWPRRPAPSRGCSVRDAGHTLADVRGNICADHQPAAPGAHAAAAPPLPPPRPCDPIAESQ